MDELNKLESYLKEQGIKYERTDRDDGDERQEFHRILVYDDDKPIWDAVCHFGSIGYEQGLLEVMGSLTETLKIEGNLTADDIIRRLEA